VAPSEPAPVVVTDLVHHFPTRVALAGASFEVRAGEMFGLLGPNGCGKSTLFRILSCLLRPTSGAALVYGFDVRREPDAVRARIGVVFQSPALDDQLTIRENLRHAGHLQGLSGALLRQRTDDLVGRLGLSERVDDRVGRLSGGLARRADLARGLLHHPRLLLLDEPSAGLDPGARRELWTELGRLRERLGLTVLLTTHLMDEAERCDRIAVMDLGRIVALGSPAALKGEIGGEVITLQADDLDALCGDIRERFGLEAAVLDGAVRLEHPDGHALIPRLVEAFPRRITSLTVQVPTLEDVFVHRTGHAFHGPMGTAERVA
jgi:ABC-2 type transport system ATP-binding protein